MLNKKQVSQGKAEIRAQLGYMQQTALLVGRPDSAPLLPNQPTLEFNKSCNLCQLQDIKWKDENHIIKFNSGAFEIECLI